jgi:hypothetical protein
MELFIVYFCYFYKKHYWDNGDEEDKSENPTENVIGIFSSLEKAETFVAKRRKELDDYGIHRDGNNYDLPLTYDWEEYKRKKCECERKFIDVDTRGAWLYIGKPIVLDEEK